MSHPLVGRHALVCGASRGIGRATARTLAEAGAQVSALARSRDELRSLVAEIEQGGGRARAVVADLDDLDSLPRHLDKLLGDAGAVHILVHNTGGPPGGPLLQAGTDEILGALRRHLVAAHLLVRHLLPGMLDAGYGRIIGVLSTSVREPIDGLGVSNLTRAAVAGWAKTLSRELPPGVTINNVLPGFTDTERLAELARSRAAAAGCTTDQIRDAWRSQVPEQRFAEARELAAAIRFLASPDGAYVRGVSLPVDGGRLRSI